MKSDEKMRWDKRRTGRTIKMLAAAFAKAFHGERVVVVLEDMDKFDYCLGPLKDMGITRISVANHMVMVGNGHGSGTICFTWLGAEPLVPGTFEVKGWHPDNVFWDHEAVRRLHNHILMRFHEYD